MTVTHQDREPQNEHRRRQPTAENKPSRSTLERSSRPARRWSVTQLILAAQDAESERVPPTPSEH